VVVLPVQHGGQRKLVEVLAGHAERPRGEAELLRGAAEVAKRRAVRRRVRELAQPRHGDAAAEVPRHHGEAGDAAVRLVELPHVVEAPLGALLAELPLDREGLAGGRLLGSLLGLLLLHLLGHGGGMEALARQELRREAERQPRLALEVVGGEALLDRVLELGPAIHERAN